MPNPFIISATRGVPPFSTNWSTPAYWYAVTRRADGAPLGYVVEQGGAWIARRADGDHPWYPHDDVDHYATRSAAAALLFADREQDTSHVTRVTDAVFPDGTVADCYAFVGENGQAVAVDFTTATRLQADAGWPFLQPHPVYPADFAEWSAPDFTPDRAMQAV